MREVPGLPPGRARAQPLPRLHGEVLERLQEEGQGGEDDTLGDQLNVMAGFLATRSLLADG